VTAGTLDARVVLRDLLRDVRHLDARAASDLADWLAHLSVEGKADRTLYSYMREIALLLREHPDKTVDEFAAADITNTLALKPQRSRYITRSIFNSWFQWLEDQERIDRNPMPGKVPKMRQPHHRPRDIFSEAERAILESRSPLWAILFGTGLRKGEARHLRRDHIDLNRARLIVHNGKGGKDRIVPLFLSAQQAVVELDLTEQLRPTDYLWYTTRGRRKLRRDPIGDTTFERWYRRELAAADVRYLNPHQTRHTYGHWLRELGFDLEERKILMGHESIRTTEFYYGRVTVEDVAAKIKDMAL
jgi:integrase